MSDEIFFQVRFGKIMERLSQLDEKYQCIDWETEVVKFVDALCMAADKMDEILLSPLFGVEAAELSNGIRLVAGRHVQHGSKRMGGPRYPPVKQVCDDLQLAIKGLHRGDLAYFLDSCRMIEREYARSTVYKALKLSVNENENENENTH